jgi:hypothetical protein
MSLRSWLARRVLPSQEPKPRPGRRRMELETCVEDCAAFLAGTLAEYRVVHGQTVLPWEWTNLLAHGDLAALRFISAGCREEPVLPIDEGPVARWQAARALLIADLLDLAETSGRSLSDLQQSVVIPFELELAEFREAHDWGPEEWLVAVNAVFSAYRRRTLHPFTRRPPTSD